MVAWQKSNPLRIQIPVAQGQLAIAFLELVIKSAPAGYEVWHHLRHGFDTADGAADFRKLTLAEYGPLTELGPILVDLARLWSMLQLPVDRLMPQLLSILYRWQAGMDELSGINEGAEVHIEEG